MFGQQLDYFLRKAKTGETEVNFRIQKQLFFLPHQVNLLHFLPNQMLVLSFCWCRDNEGVCSGETTRIKMRSKKKTRETMSGRVLRGDDARRQEESQTNLIHRKTKGEEIRLLQEIPPLHLIDFASRLLLRTSQEELGRNERKEFEEKKREENEGEHIDLPSISMHSLTRVMLISFSCSEKIICSNSGITGIKSCSLTSSRRSIALGMQVGE